jgi:hypothetical protein
MLVVHMFVWMLCCIVFVLSQGNRERICGHSLITHQLWVSQAETGPLVEIVPSLRAHKTTNCGYVGRDVLTALTAKSIYHLRCDVV